MFLIDLCRDAEVFEDALAASITRFRNQTDASEPICAIEIGYECEQSGWVLIHADRRDRHERDGQWTLAIDEKNLIAMPHWAEAMEARFRGEEVKVTRTDGSAFVIGPDEMEDLADAEESGDGDDQLAEEIGQMLLDVMMAFKIEDRFDSLGPCGTIQLDIEEFNGSWAWPDYDDLGVTNIA